MNIVFPHKPGSGGPGSFQTRFEKVLKERGFVVSYATDVNSESNLVFVVGGTKKIGWLRKMKKKGVPILYRLDGINWLHRTGKYGVKKFFIDEYRNLNSKIIHAFFADYIVYQSEFVHKWWDKVGLKKIEEYHIINNGVDINEFNDRNQSPNSKDRLVILEGTIDYTPYAIELMNELAFALPKNIQIDVYGRFEDVNNIQKLNQRINYHGLLPRTEVSDALKNSIYLSLDINAACPNTVVEALASGSPVVGFDTGALKELVVHDSGIIVEYLGNPWKLEKPNYSGLIEAIVTMSNNYQYYSVNARKLAEERYDINNVVNHYIEVIIKTIQKNKNV